MLPAKAPPRGPVSLAPRELEEEEEEEGGPSRGGRGAHEGGRRAARGWWSGRGEAEEPGGFPEAGPRNLHQMDCCEAASSSCFFRASRSRSD